MEDLGAGCWEVGWGGGGLAAALLCPGCGLPWCLCALSSVCLLIVRTYCFGAVVGRGCALPFAGGPELLEKAFLILTQIISLCHRIALGCGR